MRAKNSSTIILYILNILFALIILAPFIYLWVISFTPPNEIYDPGIIPSRITFENFEYALSYSPILKFIFNSFFVCTSVVALQVLTCSMAAFAFAFMEFKGKNLLFTIVLATLMVPGEATIISNFLTISSWGWTDTYKALIIPYTTSAMGIFLLRQFYLTLPKEIQESATLDGCGNLRFLIQMVIPLSRPSIGAFAIYSFLNTWNMYMWPLLVTNKNSVRTVQVGVGMLNNLDSQSIGLLMAGVTMVTIPSILIFILGNKQIVEGMTSGAVKS